MPSLRRLGLVLRTTRHLRPRQILGQLTVRARGPARTPARVRAPGVTDLAPCAAPDALSPEGRPGPDGIALVGRPPHDPRRHGWNAGANALWTYTLHYHGWIGHPDTTVEDALATLHDWIGEHPRGVGWEPYPTSLRVLHWLGWLHRHGAGLQAHARERVLDSLAAQLEHLADHVEFHIDGNHLWTNLVALVAGGLALRGPLPERLLARFGPRLVTTIHEQLSGDGVHGERTPSYHCLLAEQLAVLLPFARARQPRLADALAPASSAMLGVLPSFTHPDGDVALWGDSQRDAPVTPAGLAARAGLPLALGHADAPVSGFSRRRWGPLTLLWNRGDVGLSHQVGHIHGDALSIELSLGATRILADAGVGTYDIGPERAYARSTAAHNTVGVGPGISDQHELWASHRIGARARCETLACAEHRLEGRVHGYATGAAHRRLIEHHAGVVTITDTLEPSGPPGVVRYFVPQSCRLVVHGDVATITAAGRRCRLTAVGGTWHQSPAPGWLGMGRPAPRTCLSLPLSREGARVTLEVLDL